MRVLNLYSGIGGNRKLWKGVKVTAVELDSEIAEVYQDFFPDDQVIVADAHKYLLDHYDEDWDLIWSSPPCPSHSRIRYAFGVRGGKTEAIYPDMSLWQEIIFLQHHAGYKWVVENVIPYYPPMFPPSYRSNKHYLWSNFHISKLEIEATGIAEVPDRSVNNKTIEELEKFHGFDLSDYDIDKYKALRNCVNPKLGKHILDCMRSFRTLDFFISGDSFLEEEL